MGHHCNVFFFFLTHDKNEQTRFEPGLVIYDASMSNISTTTIHIVHIVWMLLDWTFLVPRHVTRPVPRRVPVIASPVPSLVFVVFCIFYPTWSYIFHLAYLRLNYSELSSDELGYTNVKPLNLSILDWNLTRSWLCAGGQIPIRAAHLKRTISIGR